MFQELKKVRQDPADDGYRRWFSDEGYDLIVWYSKAGSIRGFQLCYDTKGRERAFTWQVGHPLTHSAIDNGESSPLRNRAPVLTHSKRAAPKRVLNEFIARSAMLEVEIIGLVVSKLSTFEPGAD